MTIMYSGLSILFLFRILGCKQQCRNKPLLHRLEVSPRAINNAFPPLMSKEPEEKMNRHAHITYIMARGIKPNRVYEPTFQKEENRGRFSNRPETGSFWTRLSKRKIKEVLKYTTDHTVRYSNACIVM